jgi:hypothetical protein
MEEPEALVAAQVHQVAHVKTVATLDQMELTHSVVLVELNMEPEAVAVLMHGIVLEEQVELQAVELEQAIPIVVIVLQMDHQQLPIPDLVVAAEAAGVTIMELAALVEPAL